MVLLAGACESPSATGDCCLESAAGSGRTCYVAVVNGGSSSSGSNSGSANPSNKGQQIANIARCDAGYGYAWGGASPSIGFDCSGLVQYVFGQAGVWVPRTSQQQSNAG
ncbi:C40 family peptidase [Lactobacillus sp. DCY120]|uniref:C40 family peptidase n=1 Tax=Bombilactobacillus apium TaxID=2675299 RepID=A0A850R6G9_9LACO|nr:C40 family peptidase [Bombilactobacillus apium]